MKKLIVIFLIVFLSINLSAQVFDHIYTNNVSWNSDPVLTGSIWIRPGVSLTINSGVSVQMPDNSFIFVDVGAKIIANGVSFEAANNYWLGITCRGTNSIYTTAPYEFRTWAQPIVQISNSEISGMSLGIWSNSPVFNYSGETPNTTGGGRLQISNTVFSSNPIYSSAIVNFYHNRRIVNQNHINDLGFVSKCTFNDIESCGVYIHSSRNVKVLGCSFDGSSLAGDIGTGVYCTDGSVMVDSYVSLNNTVNSSFNKLAYGVYIADPQIVQQNSFVRQATFTNCLRGITVLSSPNLRIFSNTMTVPSHASMETHGIHIAGCTGFHIEDNTITGTSSSGDPVNTWGILVDNAGANPNTIYRNTLIDCEYGLVGQGANRDPLGDEFGGLKFQCNDFTSFDDAYYMASLKYDLTNPSHGVGVFQAGAIIGEPSSPCYNSMVDRILTVGSENDFYNQNSIPAGFDILYFCPGGPNGPGVYDLKYKSPSVSRYYSPIHTTSTSHCESRLPCFGPLCPVGGAESIENMFATYSTLRQNLASTINGGDHAYMLGLVENVTENNRYIAYYS